MVVRFGSRHVYLWYPEVVIPFNLFKYAFMMVLLFAYFMLDIRMQVAPVGVDDDVKEAANPVGDQNNPENKVSNSDLGLRRRIKIEKLNNFLQVKQAKDLDQSKEPEN